MTSDEKNTNSTIIPTIRYLDAAAAVDWLCEAFGFEKHLVVPGDDGDIVHAQLVFGKGMVMVGSSRDGIFDQFQAPLSSPDAKVSQSPYIIVADVDKHHDRAVSVGAKVVIEPENQEHGGRLYSCRDPEGHLWNFGSYDPWETP